MRHSVTIFVLSADYRLKVYDYIAIVLDIIVDISFICFKHFLLKFESGSQDCF